MKRTVSIAPLTTPQLGPRAYLLCAAEAGFRHVALRLIGGDPARPPADMPPLVRDMREIAELRTILDGEGVAVREIEVLVLAPHTDVAASRPMLEAAQGLGATELVVGVADPDPARAADRLAEAAALSREHGLSLNLEFVSYSEVRDLAAARDFIARSGVEDAAILVDTFHLAVSGSSFEEVAALPTSMRRYLQLADAPAAIPRAIEEVICRSREARLDPGAGEQDVAKLLRLLPPNMPVSIEVPNIARIARKGPVAHMRRVREATERLLATAAR